MERAVRLARRAGVETNPAKCPSCGGKIELNHEISFKRQYQYSIGCIDHDCSWVFAPTVKAAIVLWNETCAELPKLT